MQNNFTTPIRPANRLSLQAGFKQIKKLLLPAAFLLAFSFFAAPASAQVSINAEVSSSTFSNYQVSFTVFFTTAQTGLSPGNFTITGTVTGASIIAVSGSGQTFVVLVGVPNNYQSSGTIILNLVNNTGLSPGVSGLPYASPSVTDVLYPLTGSMTLSSSNANPGYAKAGDMISFVVSSDYYGINQISAAVDNQTFNGSANAQSGGGEVTLDSSAPQGPLTYGWQFVTTFSTNGNGNGTSSIIFDSINPTVGISAPSSGIAAGNGSGSVSYTVTYADANFGSSSLTTSGITLNTTGTATGTLGISGSGTTYTVTITNITGNGTLGISVGAGYAVDLAGNTEATGAGPSSTVAVVPNVSPSISYASPQGYAINSAISALTPTVTVGITAFTDQPSASSGVALDYNGNAYTVSGGNIIQNPPANAAPVTAYSGGNAGTTNIATAAISATSSTIIFGAGPIISAIDYTNGVFQSPVNVIPEGGANLVAATHPATGPEIAMICEGNTSQITFLTRTGGVWSAPSSIINALTTTALAINTYQGGLMMAYIGTDNNLYYATYSGGTWSAVTPWGSPNISLSGITTLALDLQGNVWYTSGTSLNELTPGSTSPITITTLPATPNSIAFDISGNLYVNYSGLIQQIQVARNFLVTPALPAGLSINSTTGIISGTPTALTAANNYTVTATSGNANLTAAVNIAIITTPSLSYGSGLNATIGTAITPILPTSSSILAQHYNSTPATFVSAIAPTGLATDGAGNVYVAENGGSVVKIPAGGGLPTPISGGSTFGPLATDAAGNFYASYANGSVGPVTGVSVFPASASIPAFTINNSMVSTGGSAGMGVDAAGNVYAAGLSPNIVYEYIDPLNTKPNLYGQSTAISIGTGFTLLSGLAVDAAGDVYVTDAGAGTIDVIPANRGQWTTLASGLGAPANIIIDGGGNLYFSDNSTNTIREIPAGSTTPVVIASGLGSVTALAIDGTGKLYAADNTNSVIDEFSPLGGYFINPALPPGFNFNGGTGAISGTPTVASAAANYTITAYNPIGSVSATQSIAATASLPTLSYSGTLGFTTGSAGTITPVSTGVAAQGYATVPVFLDYKFGQPWAVAVDTSLNVYVADPWNFGTKSLAPPSPVNGPYYNPVFTQGTTAPAFYTPLTSHQLTGVAVDSTGSVYIAKNPSGFAKLAVPAPGTYVETIISNSQVNQSAIDSKGNLFATTSGGVAQYTTNSITPIASGFSDASGITVDGLGNIFVSDYSANTLYKIPAGSNTATAVATGFNQPWELAADGTGNIFIADGGNGVIKEYPAGGGAVTTVLSALQTPKGVAVDVNGVLYVADAGFAQVRKYTPTGGYYISPALPVGLSFNNATGVISGTPTAAAPVKTYKISAYNLSGRAQTTVTFGVVLPGSNLANLTLSAGSLSPAFAAATLGYTVNANYTSTQTTVTPTTADPNATVTVNGTAVTPGSASSPIALSVGANTISVVVTASDNSSTQTYTVTVNRAGPPNNALLSNVGIGYVMVGSTVEAVVTPAAADPLATITVNGTAVASGTASNPIPLSPGANAISIVVTAQDGLTKTTYKVTVDGPLGSTSTLSALTISAGTLSGGFASAKTSYTDAVASTIASVTVTPTTTDPNATVTVNTAAVTSGTPSSAITLNVGMNTISTVVTAQDGVTKTTYTIAVTRTASTNAILSVIKLTPASALTNTGTVGTTTTYTTSVPNGTASVTLTPTAQDANATIRVNGVTVASGTASAAIPLAVGVNTITTIVTAQDGVTTHTYKITLTRAPSTNALISNIQLTPASVLTNTGTIGTTTSYTATVSSATTSVTLTATAADATATIKVNGITVASGAASGAIAVPPGQTIITTVLTAQDGVTTHTYIITVTRLASNALLSIIKLTPASALTNTGTVGTTTTYTTSVPNSTASVTITPTAQDANATIKVNGAAVTSGTASAAIALAEGATTTINTVVTAQDGVTTHTYSITLTRAPSSNTTLSVIKLTPASSLTNTGIVGTTTSYITTAASATTSVTLTPTAADVNATIKVNGVSVASGAASGAIAVPFGQTIITTVVTAQDGITTHTYIITITRLSNNSLLSVIKLTPASALTNTGTVGTTTSYTTSVPNGTASVTLTATSQDANATIKVNGAAVTSGTASGAIALAVGANTITTIVTAQDGVSTHTYIITVTRAAPLMSLYLPGQLVSVTKPADQLTIEDDGVLVHQGLSPNGDGINDLLIIDGITAYPDNRLTIIDRNGSLIFLAKGYDNISKAFDGRSSISGRMQQPGTYFYSLDYNVNGQSKHKTGFILLKY